MRTGPQVPQTSCTLESAMRLSCSAIPPLMLRCGLGRTCFFTIMTCSTRILLSFGNTRSTRPSLPLSRPVITLTVSLRRISTRLFSVLTIRISSSQFLALFPGTHYSELGTRNSALNHFRRQRNDLQELLLAQLAGHRTEHACAHRF